MVLCIHSLVVCISLCMLMQYGVNARKLEWSKKPQNLGFSWRNCGSAADPIQILSLSIGPDPIRLPGNVVISTSLNISKPFPVDVIAHVGMQKNVFGIWINVPCEHNVGSCSYSVCSNATAIYPDIFGDYHEEKKCPSIPPAVYSVSNLVESIAKSIPSIAEGGVRMDINLVSNYAGHIACLHLDVNLKS